jgi:hypothetical protein
MDAPAGGTTPQQPASAHDSFASQYDVQDTVPTPTPQSIQTAVEQARPVAPTVAPAAPQPAVAATQGSVPAAKDGQAAAAATTTATPGHPAWLTAKATELGVHPLIVDRFDTAQLTQYVFDQLSQARAIASQNHQATIVGQGHQVPATPTVPVQPASPSGPGVAAIPAAPQVPAAPQQPAFDWGTFDDVDDFGRPVKKQFTDADINPAIAHHVKAQAERIAKLESFIATMSQQVTTARESQVQKRFDELFNGVPEVFGAGSAAQVRASAPAEFQRRSVVYNAVKEMVQSSGGQLSPDEAFRIVTKSLFGRDVPQVAAAARQAAGTGQQPASPGASFPNATVAVPTQRQAPTSPPGKRAAVDAVSQWWQDQAGAAVGSGVDTSLEEFLP